MTTLHISEEAQQELWSDGSFVDILEHLDRMFGDVEVREVGLPGNGCGRDQVEGIASVEGAGR